MPQSGPTCFGEQQRLIVAVEEVGFEAVERFERELDAFLLAVLVALLQRLDRPLPLFVGRALRLHLADGRGDDGDFLAFQLLHHRDACL